jgi:hypothetical protein
MKETLLLLAAFAAIATAAPLDKPLTVAVREVSENTPAIKALWETYLAADLVEKSAQGELDAARRVALMSIRPEEAKTRMVVASLMDERKAALAALDALKFSDALAAHLAEVGKLKTARRALELKAEFPQFQYKSVFASFTGAQYAGETVASIDQKITEKTATFEAAKQAALTAHAAVGQIDDGIAAQKAALDDAAAVANPDMVAKQTALAQATAAKHDAWEAYKDAVVAKLTADYPESAAVIELFAAAR